MIPNPADPFAGIDTATIVRKTLVAVLYSYADNAQATADRMKLVPADLRPESFEHNIIHWEMVATSLRWVAQLVQRKKSLVVPMLSESEDNETVKPQDTTVATGTNEQPETRNPQPENPKRKPGRPRKQHP